MKKRKENEKVIYNSFYNKEKELLDKENEKNRVDKENENIKLIEKKAKYNVRNPFHKKLIKNFDLTTKKVVNRIITNLEENERNEKSKKNKK